MNIAVIEYRIVNHSVMLKNWIDICQRNDWSIKIFTTQECFNQIKKTKSVGYEKLQVCIIDKYTILNAIRIRNELKEFDKVIFNSIYDSYLFFLVLIVFSENSCIHIHNINKWLNTSWDFRLRIRTNIHSFLRKMILSSSHVVIVNSENMLDYLVSKKRNISSFVVPFSMKQREYQYNTKKNRHFVVYPGIVDVKRKRFESFIELAKDNPEDEFCLLGKVASNSRVVIERIKNENIKNIIYFDDNYIPQEVYDDYMRKATILFSDIRIEFEQERYGITKDTGVSYLMSEYCLPLFINEDFNNVSCLDSVTNYFNSVTDLKVKFKELDKRNIYKLSKDIKERRKAISVDVISRQVKAAFNDY